MCVISSNANAQRGFLGGETKVDRFFVQSNGKAFVGLDGDLPANACSFFQYYFNFDSTTEVGKNLLSVVMTAQVSKSTVNIWYIHSVAEAGTDQTNGCGQNNMAVLDAIGLRN